MKKSLYLSLFFVFFFSTAASAQFASLDRAKNITVLKVVASHKMHDADLVKDVNKLRQIDKFNKELRAMLDKLDNDKPNSAKNQKVMRILEKAGKDIYNELK